MYEEIIRSLKLAYDRTAVARDAGRVQPWKLAERSRFAQLLEQERAHRILEIGSGPGRHAQFFREKGFDITCTDLSPEMVARCRKKGLTAHVMDFLSLDFEAASFDAVFSMNCLLHVPQADLPRVLSAVHRLVRPHGLFYYGVYGGSSFEGIWPDDDHEPRRYFVFYPDETLLEQVAELFDVMDFHRVALESERESHFQSLTLRRRETG